MKASIYTINLELPTPQFIQHVSKVLESMSNVCLLFTNVGSPNVPPLNASVLCKLINLKNTNSYNKGSQISIQNRQLTLF